MSQSASQAADFYREVAEGRTVWTLRDKGGFPQPLNSSGIRSQPFWSSQSRVETIIKTVPAYSKFSPHGIPWDEFVARWVPGLSKDGVLAGVNWSGERATGYDIKPEDLQRNVEAINAA